jgi:hypothetical protein
MQINADQCTPHPPFHPTLKSDSHRRCCPFCRGRCRVVTSASSTTLVPQEQAAVRELVAACCSSGAPAKEVPDSVASYPWCSQL